MEILPEKLKEQKEKIVLKEEYPTFTSSYSDYSTYSSLGYDQPFKEEDLTSMKMAILKNTPEEVVFDVAGVDLSVVNALRRILIAEVPTIAIEDVFLANNTSVISDEVLCHRIGLIPLDIDPSKIKYKKPDEEPNQFNTIIFKLQITCTSVPGSRPDMAENLRYNHSNVYSRDLEWVPISDEQRALFADHPPKPVFGDILIAKLRPKQTIDLTCHCVKGIGKWHAKFSPVATATYRLLPSISFKKPLTGNIAEAVIESCPLNVFEMKDGVVTVARPRNCSMCRECIRTARISSKGVKCEEYAEDLELARVKDYCIFSVESTGILDASTLVEQAFDVLIAKVDALISLLTTTAPTAQEAQ
ncbi:putative RNA polymerase Rpb3 [Monocercomonoides exilis]|uniref:putative RNA polymerase Rpb3 n=1 Tax=Monocercomonoides exilis TaxID=2049356 RepID=UPI00355AABB2|nr:putative RNA polymerase Rpb3 [Monocercomonoides exilis]|eukprot:MONOS_8203.1-p1 / transcript=MONOS_8203.1 / gene=MONOS_8203 / organism=Monocercomonoides_exilis_PA203 / gene_product=RNA polymerase Rpb3 / transcript_product=RNA polymerase Rpb3 / location=Mono_scaffold00303:12811-14416(+) / protein_length=358 / sequence_SO=supercontig / SO=protein_coding / is_pseudo=false